MDNNWKSLVVTPDPKSDCCTVFTTNVWTFKRLCPTIYSDVVAHRVVFAPDHDGHTPRPSPVTVTKRSFTAAGPVRRGFVGASVCTKTAVQRRDTRGPRIPKRVCGYHLDCRRFNDVEVKTISSCKRVYVCVFRTGCNRSTRDILYWTREDFCLWSTLLIFFPSVFTFFPLSFWRL